MSVAFTKQNKTNLSKREVASIQLDKICSFTYLFVTVFVEISVSVHMVGGKKEAQ